MLEELKEEVYYSNLELPKRGLIQYTWGNVSAYDQTSELFVIKPSGIDYDTMKPEDMVVCDLNCNVVEGKLNPSSDTPTHAEIYKGFKNIGSIVHTHSPWATIWAQAGKDVPALGTTHADTFFGSVPCTRFLSEKQVNDAYEQETGNLIIETFKNLRLDPIEVPGVLVKGHAPFVWGKDSEEAVMNAVVLEEICKMNFYTNQLNSFSDDLPDYILKKHYQRKHGKNAYYGQK